MIPIVAITVILTAIIASLAFSITRNSLQKTHVGKTNLCILVNENES
jgi:FlaG/FlaF family flagellin (archaellin)